MLRKLLELVTKNSCQPTCYIDSCEEKNLSYCMNYVLLTTSYMQLCHKDVKDSQQLKQCPAVLYLLLLSSCNKHSVKQMCCVEVEAEGCPHTVEI